MPQSPPAARIAAHSVSHDRAMCYTLETATRVSPTLAPSAPHVDAWQHDFYCSAVRHTITTTYTCCRLATPERRNQHATGGGYPQSDSGQGREPFRNSGSSDSSDRGAVGRRGEAANRFRLSVSAWRSRAADPRRAITYGRLDTYGCHSPSARLGAHLVCTRMSA